MAGRDGREAAGGPAGRLDRVPGLYVVGDLTGIPLLKFASDTGARAMQTIVGDPPSGAACTDAGTLDIVIVGAGVAGHGGRARGAAHGLRFVVLEATEPFSTIVNFPKGKPIYTYPTDMTPAGDAAVHQRTVKEALVEELRETTLGRGISPRLARAERVGRSGDGLEVDLAGGEMLRAHRVIVAIGRSGNFRKLGVPGEEHDKVATASTTPRITRARTSLVVGGGDSALETAIAIAVRRARDALLPQGRVLPPQAGEHREARSARRRTRWPRCAVEHPDLGARHDGGRAPSWASAPEAAARSAAARHPGRRRSSEDDVVAPRPAGEESAPERRRLHDDRPRGAARLLPALGGRDPRRADGRERGPRSPRSSLFCSCSTTGRAAHAIPYFGRLPACYPGPHASCSALDGCRRRRSPRRSRPGEAPRHARASPPPGRSFYYSLAYCAVVVVFGSGASGAARRRT